MNKIIYFFFLVITLVIVSIWFGNGKLIATGEEGLSIYRPQKTVSLYSSPWFETGLGYAIPVYLPRVTFFSMAYVLSTLLPIWQVQAFCFAFLMFSGLVGSHLLFCKLLNNRAAAVVSSLFYLLNTFTLSQVWMRFLYAGMFAWAYLPIFLYLWICLINNFNKIYLLLFIISCLIYSNTFGHPAYIITFWLPAMLYLAIKLVHDHNRTLALFALARASVILLIWAAINIWWVYPYITLSQSSFSEIASWRDNYNSLVGVSQYFRNDQLLLLRQSFLFGAGSNLANYYSSPFVSIISILAMIVALFGLITHKSRPYYYLIGLLISGWFVSKGANPPLGSLFFSSLFQNIPSTAALRNPYEKFGIVFLLSYAAFFGLGINYLLHSKRYANKAVGIIIALLSFTVLVAPVWTGKLFISSTRLTVPSKYTFINDYLSKNNVQHSRLLIFPLLDGDSVGYSWGYSGIDPSEFLFDAPVISKYLRSKYSDLEYKKIFSIVKGGGEISSLLTETNIGYILYNSDVDGKYVGDIPLLRYQQVLSESQYEKMIQRDGLVLYKVKANNALIYTQGNNSPQIINIKRRSPASYSINLNNVHEKYNLVFNNAFDRNWTAEINGKPLINHYVTNEYGNSWEITQLGAYTVNISYHVWPWE